MVGGTFTKVGAVAANTVVRWNGTAWSATVMGNSGSIHAMTTLANGDVIAVGNFEHIGGVAAKKVARLSGSTWSPVNGIAFTDFPIPVDPVLLTGSIFYQVGPIAFDDAGAVMEATSSNGLQRVFGAF